MSRGICIMQTCTAMQLPTSRLRRDKKGTHFIALQDDSKGVRLRLDSEISYLCELNVGLLASSGRMHMIQQQQIVLVPQADIVLQCKLDSIHNLRKLRHHGQQCDTDEVLQRV